MAITSKELAEHYFQQGVDLEKAERRKKIQKFDEVSRLYEEAIKIDPNHAGALINLAYLYLERKSKHLDDTKHFDEIEQYRAVAKGYYEQVLKLGQTGAKHNLRLLEMVILSEQITDCEYDGRYYERGDKDKGIPPKPSEAIKMYEQAKVHYDKLIPLLEAEHTRIQAIKPKMPNAKFSSYKRMIAYNKQLAEKGRADLKNIRDRNELYMQGLQCEAGINTNGNPDYVGAIDAYKKAEWIGHQAAGIMCAYLSCRNERTQEAIELRERAISLGHTNAMFDKAHLYEIGYENNDIPQFDKALALYQRAHGLGDTRAQYKIEDLKNKLLIMANNFLFSDKLDPNAPSYKEMINAVYDGLKALSHLYAEDKMLNSTVKCLCAYISYRSASDLSVLDKENKRPVINGQFFPMKKQRVDEVSTTPPKVVHGMTTAY